MNRHRAKRFRLPSMLAFAAAGATCLGLARSAAAQATDPSVQEKADLAKQLSSPIASLVSVPFQFNWEQDVGPTEATRFILNVQPVMPFSVNKDVNLIVRLIAPLISQPSLAHGGVAASGIGDVTTSVFIPPAHLRRWCGFGETPFGCK